MQQPEKVYDWIKIAEHIDEMDFGTNGIAVTKIEEKKICIGKNKEAFFAFSFTCPHAGGILAEGCINTTGHVVCPLHGYTFNIQTGYNISGEGYHLKHWPVQIKAEGVFIGMDAMSSQNDMTKKKF